MRLFVSIQLSPESAQALQAAQRTLEERAPGVYRWTDLTTLHLTLYFLGEMPDANDVTDRLNMIKMPSFHLGWGGLVKLPSPDVPKILAAGVLGDVDQLRSLQRQVQDLMYPIAENKETRAYFPHATIGRLKREVPPSAKIVKRALADFTLPDGQLETVSSFELMSSELTSEGAKHTVVEQFQLGKTS